MSISTQRAEELLAAFSNKRVLVIGDAFVDSYVQGEIERLNPESHHVPLLRVGYDDDKDPKKYRSGGAGNTARNLVSLGAQACLLSVRGKDKLGTRLVEIAQREKYKPCFVIDPNRKTIEKRRYITKDGALFRVDHEPKHIRPMGERVVSQLTKQVKVLLVDADAILVSDYAKGLLTEKFCNVLVDFAQSMKVPVLADVKPAQTGHFVGVAMMAPNLKEASESLGVSINTDPLEVAPLLAKRHGTEVFLTAGSQGICVAGTNKDCFMVEQLHKVKVGDTSGCGDTAAAAILLAKLCGASSEEAAELANAAAAVTVTMVGAYAPTPVEVLRMLAS